MTGYHIRTENGTPVLLPSKEALAEVDLVMMDKAAKRTVREMSWARSSGHIVYRDGRKVAIRPATEQDITDLTLVEPVRTVTDRASNTLHVVEAKGKTYLVGHYRPAKPRTEGAKWWRDYASVSYWTERDGKTLGSTRHAGEESKPGTVAAAVWTAFQAVSK